MECADVGLEAWLFFAITTAMVVAFVIRGGATQRWLREHPQSWARRSMDWAGGLMPERKLWLFRIVLGFIPALIWVASLSAVYCFFHGPDYPPLGR
jgi:hypothetical protein